MRRVFEMTMGTNKLLLAVVWVATMAIAGWVEGTPSYSVVFLEPAGYHPSASLGIGGGQQVGYGTISGSGERALLWTGSVGSVVDLNPPGYLNSSVSATDGMHQVGSAWTADTFHAGVWLGSPGSFIDLNPAGFANSAAGAISGMQLVGSGQLTTDPNSHAVLWTTLTPGGAVDLHPAGFRLSVAEGISGGQQIGFGYPTGDNDTHALLWSGSATSVVDLNGALLGSAGWGISGNQQVGWISPALGQRHAALWSGTAASAVDLNPTNLPGYFDSEALAIAGNFQVGFASGGATNSIDHAMLWMGTPSSALDLNVFLPSGYIGSRAYGVDAEGNVVGEASNGNGSQAVMWIVPEPGVFGLLGIVAARGLLRRRRF
jgi:hypothetical protein